MYEENFFLHLLLDLCVKITKTKKKFLEKWEKGLFFASRSCKNLSERTSEISLITGMQEKE